MYHLFSPRHVRKRLGITAVSLTVVMLGLVACDDQDPLAATAPEAPLAADSLPALSPDSDLTPTLATSYAGRMFGPVNLWSSASSPSWGPLPFTGSKNVSWPGGIVTQINSARNLHHRLILAMPEGGVSAFMTNGKFDLSKWKKRMNYFNTSAIKKAIAAGVSDGTIVGNQLIDEPETRAWGGNISKSMIDEMAAYAKAMFPSLPQGINVGPPGYQWRTGERFYKLDFVRYQYAWYITDGNVAKWRDAVLSRARTDGVAAAFSVNVLDGGVPDRNGSWDCGGTGGKGTYYPKCRMTSDQVRSYGKTLVASGCYATLWRFDREYMSKSANIDAFKDVASAAKSLSGRSCRRP
jgi:hypothetical protein